MSDRAVSVPRKPPVEMKSCIQCASRIPASATLCKECSSYQDWRRFLIFSQTTLALLVALFAVIAAASPHFAKLLTPYNSALNGNFVDFRKGRAVFFLSNSGRAPGIAVDGLVSLVSGPNGETTGFSLSLLADEQTIVPPGETRLVTLSNEGANIKLIKVAFQAKTSDDCVVRLRTRNFDGSSFEIEHSALCIEVIRAMFFADANEIISAPPT